MVSIYVSAYYFGAALSLWASGTLLPAFGWRGASVVLGLISALALPLALLGTWGVSPPPRRSARLNPAVLKDEPTRRTILAYGAHSWELYISRAWLPAFLAAVLVGEGLGDVESASEGAQWAGLIAGLGTAGVWIGGWLSDRWGRAQVAVTIAMASGCLSLLFGWLGLVGWWVVIVVGCVYGLLLAADSSIYSATVTEVAPEDQLGSAQAAQAFTASLASSVAPVVAGLVLDLGAATAAHSWWPAWSGWPGRTTCCHWPVEEAAVRCPLWPNRNRADGRSTARCRQGGELGQASGESGAVMGSVPDRAAARHEREPEHPGHRQEQAAGPENPLNPDQIGQHPAEAQRE